MARRYLCKTTWRCLQDVLKTSWKHIEDVLKMPWRDLEDIFKKSWRRLGKTSWRHLENVLKTSWRCLENVLKTSWRHMAKTNILVLTKTSSEDVRLRWTYSSWSRRLEDVLWRRKTSSSRRMFAGLVRKRTLNHLAKLAINDWAVLWVLICICS